MRAHASWKKLKRPHTCVPGFDRVGFKGECIPPDGSTDCSWPVILLRHHVSTSSSSSEYSASTVFSNFSHSASTCGRKLTASQTLIVLSEEPETICEPSLLKPTDQM